MPILSCPWMSSVAIFNSINASDGGIWHHSLKICVYGATIVHLNFSNLFFIKAFLKEGKFIFKRHFVSYFFFHHFGLFFWEHFHTFISCHSLHDVLTKKEKMTSRKSKHLANYQMNGSLLPKNQASCNFLTACNFLIETTWLLGANEATGNFENDECCHVFKSVLWNKTTLSFTLLCESESVLKCLWGM